MSIFDNIVAAAIAQNTDFPVLQNVIEKELLHHDIIRVMNETGFLKNLTFIGGTCLRDCYGSPRLSEDLDFTGGNDFSNDEMNLLAGTICREISKKYELPVSVSEPQKEIGGNVETWKFKITTRPEKRDFPAQKINVDISLVPSRERKVQILKNPYGIELGTNGILLYAESLPEIFCDKLIAFARRPNRVKNRDLFDIHFLNQKSVPVNYDLLAKKLADRDIVGTEFWAQFSARCDEIVPAQQYFVNEMRRFLPATHFTSDFQSPLWWEYLQNLLREIAR